MGCCAALPKHCGAWISSPIPSGGATFLVSPFPRLRSWGLRKGVVVERPHPAHATLSGGFAASRRSRRDQPGRRQGDVSQPRLCLYSPCLHLSPFPPASVLPLRVRVSVCAHPPGSPRLRGLRHRLLQTLGAPPLPPLPLPRPPPRTPSVARFPIKRGLKVIALMLRQDRAERGTAPALPRHCERGGRLGVYCIYCLSRAELTAAQCVRGELDRITLGVLTHSPKQRIREAADYSLRKKIKHK